MTTFFDPPKHGTFAQFWASLGADPELSKISKLRQIVGQCDLRELQHIASAMSARLNEFCEQYPDNSNLAEASDFAHSIALNLAGAREEIAKPYIPHEKDCKCDSCEAARSDERHDRHHDDLDRR